MSPFPLKNHNQEVCGIHLDRHSRCLHYASILDVIAIKFYCCRRYYACYECHQTLANHPAERWPRGEFHEKAILCAACGLEMTIYEYLRCNHVCPSCKASFNEGCELHWNLYFTV